MKDNSLIIIPTYNEAENIKAVINKIFSLNDYNSILVVDDNSPDRTSNIVRNLKKNYDDKLFLITREKKDGLGSAYKEGFKWALNRNFDYVTTIDADLSHNPDLIPEMVKNIEKYNIIITGRFLKDNTLEEWPLIRKLITTIRHRVIKYLLNIPYDTSGAFRCYNFNKIKIEDLLMAKDNGYSFFWESLFILYKKNYSILEIPMKQPRRIYGSSKITIKDIFRAITYLIYFYFKKKF